LKTILDLEGQQAEQIGEVLFCFLQRNGTQGQEATESRLADLLDLHLAPHTPTFYYTSCDYFGPYNVKIGRNKQMKHYGGIFTCLNMRAVHLELAVDLSTIEFMQVLQRFFSI